MSALDLRLLGRLGGAGLLAGAVALFALMGLPHWDQPSSPVTVAVSIAAAVGGLAALRARWSEDATRAGMVLAGGAYVALGVCGLAGGSQAAYGPLFVVVAAWCGLALGPSYTLKLAPLALACATAPAWVGNAWQPTHRHRRDRRRDRHRRDLRPPRRPGAPRCPP